MCVAHRPSVAALFSPSANTPYRAALLAIIVVGSAAIAAPMIYIRLPYAADVNDSVEQPVAFDHRHHVRDDGIDCVYCHESVETGGVAGFPSTDRCMGCHAQIWPDSPKLAPVRESWRTKTPLHWKRLTALPAFVYFSHGAHEAIDIPCARCHGEVEDMPRVHLVHRMTMNFCLDCHREHQGSRAITRITTCSACHR